VETDVLPDGRAKKRIGNYGDRLPRGASYCFLEYWVIVLMEPDYATVLQLVPKYGLKYRHTTGLTRKFFSEDPQNAPHKMLTKHKFMIKYAGNPYFWALFRNLGLLAYFPQMRSNLK
jgi:hypothetical protein